MTFVIMWALTNALIQISHYLLPKTLHPQQRPVTDIILQLSLTSFVFIIIFLISQRAVLSTLITLTIAGVFLVVNQAKYKALQEALVFSDVYLYIQVIRHPRLFLPFLNLPITLSAITAGLILLAFAISLETPTTLSALLPDFGWTIILLLSAVLCGIIIYQLAVKASPLHFDANQDVRQRGFYNSLIIYTLQAQTQRQHFIDYLQQHSPYTQVSDTSQSAATQHKNTTQPNLIVIQSESFFDARRLYPAIKHDVLKNFDQCNAEALAHGTLEVPAWGANTLRPEFSFLSGIPNESLKHFRFNPYQYLQTQTTPTLASHLKAQGYYCVCIHPNSAQFFARNKVFPHFGFDEFIDIADFDTNDRAGPYISDDAVRRKIQDTLVNAQQPLFIFAITMENHGPLHLETPNATAVESYYSDTPPKHHHDLTVYLKHLHNADHMLKKLRDFLREQTQETTVCFYGDHVPSMPKVYQELEFQNGRTDYFIWNNQQQTNLGLSQVIQLPIERLGIWLSYTSERDKLPTNL